MTDEKQCFFLSPIGEEGSEQRQRSNKLMEYVISPAAEQFGYSVERADQLDEPGSITSQVIQRTTQCELVVADLTGHNPNVFYELAVRHATGKPFIQLIESSERIPFDLKDLRTIQYGLGVEEADEAKKEIQSHLESMEEEEPYFDNPISHSAEMKSLEESEDPKDQTLAEVLQRLSKIDGRISKMERSIHEPNQENFSTVGNKDLRTWTENEKKNVADSASLTEESVESLAENYGIPPEDMEEALEEIYMDIEDK